MLFESIANWYGLRKKVVSIDMLENIEESDESITCSQLEQILDEDELEITDSMMELAAPTSSLLEATNVGSKSIIEKDNLIDDLDS